MPLSENTPTLEDLTEATEILSLQIADAKHELRARVGEQKDLIQAPDRNLEKIEALAKTIDRLRAKVRDLQNQSYRIEQVSYELRYGGIQRRSEVIRNVVRNALTVLIMMTLIWVVLIQPSSWQAIASFGSAVLAAIVIDIINEIRASAFHEKAFAKANLDTIKRILTALEASELNPQRREKNEQ